MSAPDRAEFFERAVAQVIERPALEKLLDSGRRLRWKLGLDPTRPNLHLGHAVGLRKMRQGALWGHEVLLIVGDWTAQVGDPSDRLDARPGMPHAEVLKNAETYLEQFHRIVPKENVRVVMQSEWFGKFTLTDVMHLASRFTAQQMLARETFKDRLESGRPIPLTDILYGLLQAHDSVAIQADVEFGGTDQKFNILLGRELQAQVGQTPQQVFLWQLLPGLDGLKMSKSTGNGIWLTDPPNEMYGKIMSVKDELMLTYFEWATELPLPQARATVAALKDGSLPPRDAKRLLARTIVSDLYGAGAGEEGEKSFDHVHVHGRAPEELETIKVNERDLLAVLVAAGLASSRGEARRLIQQKGVKVNGEVVTDASAVLERNGAVTLQVGPRRFARVELVD